MTPPAHLTVSAYQSAELTEFVLLDHRVSRGQPGSARAALAVLIFDVVPASPRFDYLTDKLENVPGGRWGFLAARSTLAMSDALPIVGSDPDYTSPLSSSGPTPVACPGRWLGPVFVSLEEHPARDCLPGLAPLWLEEKWRTDDSLLDALGDAGLSFVQQRVRDLSGIDLVKRVDRFGNLLVSWLDARCSVRQRMSRDWTKVGIVTRIASGVSFSDFVLHVRGTRAGNLAVARQLPLQRRVVVDFGTPVTDADVEIYEAKTGAIVYRNGYQSFRTFNMQSKIVSTKVDFTFTLEGRDGAHSRFVRVKTQWGTTMGSTAGATPTWETRQREAELRAEQRTLGTRQKLFLYEGGPEERSRAISDIRDLLHNNIHGYLKIWDSFLDAEDAVRFLASVFDPSIPIRVITSRNS